MAITQMKTLLLSALICTSIYAQPDTDELSKLSIEELMRVEVITPGKFEQENWKASGKVFIIDQWMIKDRGYKDLLEALRDIPFFQVQSEFGHWTKGGIINLRGHRSGDSGNNKFLVLIDGTKISDDAEEGLYMGMNSFPLNDVKQIEIVYGPNSTLYGRDAYAAMINIITRTAEYAEAGFSYGTYDSQNIFAGLNKKFSSDLTGNINFSQYLSDEQDPRNISVTYLNRHIFPNAPFTENFYRASRNSRLNLGLKYRGLKLNYILFDLEGSETYGGNPDFYLTDYSTQTKLINQVLQASYETRITSDLSTEAYFNYKNYELDPSTANLYTEDFNRGLISADSIEQIDPLFGYGGRKYYYFRTMAYKTGVKLVSNLLDKLTNVSGADVNYVYGIPVISAGKGMPPITTEKQRDALEHYIRNGDLFTEFNYELSDNLNIALGARADFNSNFENTFMPRLAINTRFSNNIIKIILSKGYLAPSITQSYFSSLNTFSLITPNSDLRPEKISGAEAEWMYLWNNSHISANVFYNKLKDGIIESIPTGETAEVVIGNKKYIVPVLKSQNVSNGNRRGFGLELRNSYIDNKLIITANYSLIAGEDKINQNNGSVIIVPVDENLNSTHTLNLGALMKYDRFSLYASAQWFSKRKIKSHHSTTLYSEFLDNEGYLNFDPVLLVNINFRVNKIFNGVSLYSKVTNLLDKEYYGQSITANWGSPKILQNLRRIEAGFEYSF